MKARRASRLGRQGRGHADGRRRVLDLSDRSFTASDVLAGDSVPGPRFDVVHGNVIARAGDMLTVRGGR